MDQDRQIEHVARAFYSVENDEHSWDLAPSEIKDAFRNLAYDAVTTAALLSGSRINQSSVAHAGSREMMSA